MRDHFEDITVTGSITVKHPDAPWGLKIMAAPDGAGIWIGPEKTFVAIHYIAGQCCLALAGPKDKGGHAFAISIDPKDGEVTIQLCRPGKEPAVILSGDKLSALLEGGQ